MYVATYEMSSQTIWNALLHNVYHRIVYYFSYETSMAEKLCAKEVRINHSIFLISLSPLL